MGRPEIQFWDTKTHLVANISHHMNIKQGKGRFKFGSSLRLSVRHIYFSNNKNPCFLILIEIKVLFFFYQVKKKSCGQILLFDIMG